MGIKECMLFLTLIITSMLICLTYYYYISPTLIPNQTISEKQSTSSWFLNSSSSGIITKQYPVTFAYLISAAKGDTPKLKRLLHALYHPGNWYLIHIDYGAPRSEHLEMEKFLASTEMSTVVQQVGNVWIVGKPNLVTYRGPTMLAATLHAMAILLRTCNTWDWFINLSASDYPLVTQDGII
ncbi:hypothetical protein Dimus_030033 [Dionaea muscipula]